MPLLTQEWLDLAFIHWAVEPAAVAGLLPRGTVPDTHDGLTFVGLVAFRMHRVGRLGLPGVPYFGSFPETNVRPPNHHPRRPLYRAELTTCDEDLVTSAGLPAPTDAPVSVLYSPGVPVRLGRPARPVPSPPLGP